MKNVAVPGQDIVTRLDIRGSMIRRQTHHPTCLEAVSRSGPESIIGNAHIEGLNTMNPSNNTEQIRGCSDFQSLIPYYLDGKLSAARRLLLEDHSNECIPCRQEMKAQKAFAATKSATYVRQPVSSQKAPQRAAAKSWNTAKIARWSVAAAMVLCLGLAGLFTYERLDLSGTTLAATVESSNGLVYVVSDPETRPLAPGEQLQKGNGSAG